MQEYLLGPGTPRPTLALDFTVGFDSRISFSRASSGCRFNAGGVLESLSSNLPRLDYDPATLGPRGLLIEESRTNSIRDNSSFAGVAAGSPGTPPSAWGSVAGSINGLTRQIVGTGVEDGISYIDLRWSGTTNNTAGLTIDMDGTTQEAAAQGQTWSLSAYARLVAGSAAGITGWNLRIEERDSGGGSVNSALIQAFTPTGAKLSSQRFSGTAALTNAATAFVMPRIAVGHGNGAAVDFTLRIGLPQLEQGLFVTSPIPTSGSAATRSADVLTMPIGPWFNKNEFSLFAEFNLGSAGANGNANQYIAEFRNDSSNRVVCRASGGLTVTIIAGGVTTYNPANVGKLPNSIARVAFGIKANFNAIAQRNPSGFDGPSLSSAIPSGITVFNIGGDGNSGGTQKLNGWMRRLAYYPRRLADVELRRLVA